MTFSNNARVLASGFAREQGLDLTPEGELAVLTKLEASLRYDEKGRPYPADANGNKAVTVDRDGQVVGLGFAEFVRDIAKADPTFTRKQDPEAPKPALQGVNITERMRAMKEAEKANPTTPAAAIEGNPWAKGKRTSRTRCSLLGTTGAGAAPQGFGEGRPMTGRNVDITLPSAMAAFL